MSKKTTNRTLNKCDELIARLQELKKAIITNVASNRKPVQSLGAGWSSDPSNGSLHHSTHGIISTTKHPKGYYQINHAIEGGIHSVGRASSPEEAGMKIHNYVKNLGTHGTSRVNLNPSTMKNEDDIEKSNYGPKGKSQYNVADNVKRKANNIGEVAGEGPNTNVKSYSTKAGQLSSKQQAVLEAKKAKKLSGAVKQYTPEQIAAYEEAQKLKKNFENGPWVNHKSVPNGDEEVLKNQRENPTIVGEDAMANQLANMMNGKAMLNPNHRQPSSEDMIMAGERMGLGANPELLKANEQQWGGAINNWLAEACKPISQKFNSQEEEEAYWASIRVSDRDDGKSGY